MNPSEDDGGTLHYDLVVIGAGSGNTVADHRFTDRRVAVIEEHTIGGTCLNRGCIPSKMYIFPADVLCEAADGPRLGVRTEAHGADWPSIRSRIFDRIDDDAAAGLAHRREQDHVDLYVGTARFTGPRALVVRREDGSTVELSADQVVIATGTRPVVPPIDGLDTLVGAELETTDGAVRDGAGPQADWYTSDTVLRMRTLPARLGIVGGGYIGCELAHVMAAYGCEVVQVETAGQLLVGQDAEVAARFTELARTRWDVRTDTTLQRVRRTTGGITMHLESSAGGEQVEVDALLLAVGRTPNSDRLDLDRAGVEVDEHGVIVVDAHQRTTADGVWSLGDASSHDPLKHAANQDARVVRHNLLHPDDLVASDHDAVPQAVFSRPQVARVGLTEEQAGEQGLDVAVGRASYADIAYGWAMEERDDDPPSHFVKLLADRSTGLLVGAHLIGPQASVLVQPLILAISHRLPVRGLARSMYWIHPALPEVVEQALLDLEERLGA